MEVKDVFCTAVTCYYNDQNKRWMQRKVVTANSTEKAQYKCNASEIILNLSAPCESCDNDIDEMYCSSYKRNIR